MAIADVDYHGVTDTLFVENPKESGIVAVMVAKQVGPGHVVLIEAS